jgi:hypothetical protein
VAEGIGARGAAGTPNSRGTAQTLAWRTDNGNLMTMVLASGCPANPAVFRSVRLTLSINCGAQRRQLHAKLDASSTANNLNSLLPEYAINLGRANVVLSEQCDRATGSIFRDICKNIRGGNCRS